MKQFDESFKIFSQKSNTIPIMNTLARDIKILGLLVQSYDKIQVILNHQIPQKIYQVFQYASNQNDSALQQLLINRCIAFFKNLIISNYFQDYWMDLSKNLVLQSTILAVIFGTLDISCDENIVINGLHTIIYLIKSDFISHDVNFEVPSLECLKDKRIFEKFEHAHNMNFETLISAVLLIMSRFQKNFFIQEHGIEIFIESIKIDQSTYIPLLLKQGITRTCIMLLENPRIPYKLALKVLQLINSLVENKQALMFLTNQNAYDSIMNFVNANRYNSVSILHLVKSALEKLALAQPEGKIRETQSLIVELTDSLNEENTSTDKAYLTETIEQLLNLSITHNNIEVLVRNNAHLVIMKHFQREISLKAKFMDIQTLNLHKRILNSCILILLALFSHEIKPIDDTLTHDLLRLNLIPSLIQTLESKSELRQTVYYVLQLIVLLLKEDKTKEIFIDESFKMGFPKKIPSIFLTYKKDRLIAGLMTDLDLKITQHSSEFAGLIGQFSPIRSLVRAGMSIISFNCKQDDLENLNVILKYLLSLAVDEKSAKEIQSEDGLRLTCLILDQFVFEENLIKSFNFNEKQDIQKEKKGTNSSIDFLRPGNLDRAKVINRMEICAKNCFKILEVIFKKEFFEQSYPESFLKSLINLFKISEDFNIIIESCRIFGKALNVQLNRDYLLKNSFPDLLFKTIHYSSYLRNPDLEEIIANIMKSLDSDFTIPILGKQIIQLSDKLCKLASQSFDQYLQVLLHFSLSLKNQDIQDELLLSEVVQSIEKVLELTLQNEQILIPQINLIKMISNKNYHIRNSIASSSIIQGIVKKLFVHKKIETQTFESIETILNLILAFQVNTEESRVLCGKTGRDLKNKEAHSFLKIFADEDSSIIPNLLEIIRRAVTFKNKSNTYRNFGTKYFFDEIQLDWSTIDTQKVLELVGKIISKLAEISVWPSLKSKIVKNDGVGLLELYYQFIKNTTGNISCTVKIANILTNLADVPEARQGISCGQFFNNLTEVIQTNNNRKFKNMSIDEKKLVVQGINLMGNLSNGSFDNPTRMIVDKKCIEGIISIVREIQEDCENLLNSPCSCKIIESSMSALVKMLKNPLLFRIFINSEGIKVLFCLLDCLANASKSQNINIDLEKLLQMTDMIISDQALNKAVQETLKVIEEVIHYRSQYLQVEVDSINFSSLLNLTNNMAGDPIICFYILKILKLFIGAFEITMISDYQKTILQTANTVHILLKYYPKIELIQEYGLQVKTALQSVPGRHEFIRRQVSSEKIPKITQNLIKNRMLLSDSKDLNSSEDSVLIDICDLLDYISYSTSLIEQENEEKNYETLADSIMALEIIINQRSIIAIVRRYNILTDIIRIVSNNMASYQMKNTVLNIIRIAISFEESFSDPTENWNIVKELFIYLENVDENFVKLEQVNIQLALEISERALNHIDKSSKPNLEPFLLTLDHLTKLFLREKGPLVFSIRCISRILANWPESNKLIHQIGMTPMLFEEVERFGEDLELLKAFLEFTTQSLQSFEIQDLFGRCHNLNELYRFIQNYSTDRELNLHICSLSINFIHRHPENADRFIKSSAIKHLLYQLKFLNNEPDLMQNVFRLINTLMEIDLPDLEILKEGSVLSQLLTVFEKYVTIGERKLILECLSAIQVLSKKELFDSDLQIESSILLMISFIEQSPDNMPYVELAIRIIGNLSRNGKQLFISETSAEKMTNMLFYHLSKNQTNTRLVTIILEVMGDLLGDLEYIQMIGNKKGLSILSKVLKCQDFDQEIINKATHIVCECLTYEEYISQIVNHEDLFILKDLIKVNKRTYNTLTNIFKVLNKCVTDMQRCKEVYKFGILDACWSVAEDSIFQTETTFEFLKLLTKLAVVNEIASSICEQGSIVLINQIKDNLNYDKVVTIGLGLMSSLFTIKSNIIVLIDNGILDLLQRILEHYALDGSIIGQVKRALKNMELNLSPQNGIEIINAKIKSLLDKIEK